MSEPDTDDGAVDQPREELPDDSGERAAELKRRSESRGLTDAERRVIEEDMKQFIEATQPVMRKVSHQLPEFEPVQSEES